VLCRFPFFEATGDDHCKLGEFDGAGRILGRNPQALPSEEFSQAPASELAREFFEERRSLRPRAGERGIDRTPHRAERT
jgi:hypothetical protein